MGINDDLRDLISIHTTISLNYAELYSLVTEHFNDVDSAKKTSEDSNSYIPTVIQKTHNLISYARAFKNTLFRIIRRYVEDKNQSIHLKARNLYTTPDFKLVIDMRNHIDHGHTLPLVFDVVKEGDYFVIVPKIPCSLLLTWNDINEDILSPYQASGFVPVFQLLTNYYNSVTD